jgi:hypothetical protein
MGCDMAAPKGNRFWEARSSHGRKKLWEDPEQLWDACTQYFTWVEDNPLWEIKPFNNQGEIVEAPIAKMRAMTIGGLCIYLGMARRSWDEYRKREDFLPVIEMAEEAIRDQKFSGASAGLLNANIIARDLGLSDKQDVTSGGEKIANSWTIVPVTTAKDG